jgi:hypothetical protein
LKALSAISEEKAMVIRQKLEKVPALRKRLEALGKFLVALHAEILQLRKWPSSSSK